MKICSSCKKEKPLTYFWKDQTCLDGYKYQCKYCSKAKKYKRKPPSKKAKENKKKYDKEFAKTDTWKNMQRAVHMRKKYNLTLEDYDRMFEEQEGTCYICGEPETETFKGIVRRLSVDHSHKSGKVRKLLCGKCNRLLGDARDNVDILLSAVNYLKEHNDR